VQLWPTHDDLALRLRRSILRTLVRTLPRVGQEETTTTKVPTEPALEIQNSALIKVSWVTLGPITSIGLKLYSLLSSIVFFPFKLWTHNLTHHRISVFFFKIKKSFTYFFLKIACWIENYVEMWTLNFPNHFVKCLGLFTGHCIFINLSGTNKREIFHPLLKSVRDHPLALFIGIKSLVLLRSE
jgi:hypothetical protein